METNVYIKTHLMAHLENNRLYKNLGNNEWLGKEFKNGNDFHRSIDLLEYRINKPIDMVIIDECLTV